MQQCDEDSLWRVLSAAGNLSDRTISGATASVTLGALARGSQFGDRLEELRGRSVLLLISDQLTAAIALIELDGVARRLVLCPPDTAPEHVAHVARTADVDAVVSDRAAPEGSVPGAGTFVTGSSTIVPVDVERSGRHPTEWILLTSGTTGLPKMVVHTLPGLLGAIAGRQGPAGPAVWSTFYDIRRYGGLQIFLRGLLSGGSLVLSSAQESTGDFLVRAAARGVTHISGTPSHWRRALMSPAARGLAPRYVRLSGEIADQTILDHLRAFYPEARIAHAFASTEAGVAFDVDDGLAGFPASLVGPRAGATEMKVVDGTLRIRSARTAVRYLDGQSEPLSDRDGYVDTGDMVELRGDRYYFMGRRGGVINVGGQKVYPEEVEAVINGHPSVRMSLVRSRKNSVTGALVVADVVLKTDSSVSERRVLEQEILQLCREKLPRHKVPTKIAFVSALAVAETGKLVRGHA